MGSLLLAIGAIGVTGALAAPGWAGGFTVVNMKVEHLLPPHATGIDTPAPRFSWVISDAGAAFHTGRSAAAAPLRGVVQSAYQVQLENPGTGAVLWATGWVSCNATNLVRYTGTRLSPDTQYCWNVTSALAAPGRGTGAQATGSACFATALFGRTVADPGWHGAAWIAGTEHGTVSPLAKNVLRTTFTLPKGWFGASGATAAATATATATTATAIGATGSALVSGLGYHELFCNGVFLTWA